MAENLLHVGLRDKTSRQNLTAGIVPQGPSEQEKVKAALARKRKQTTEKAEAAVFNRALEVIGDKIEAMRWMGTPVRMLDYATPVSLVSSPNGRKAVLVVLERLEHGVL